MWDIYWSFDSVRLKCHYCNISLLFSSSLTFSWSFSSQSKCERLISCVNPISIWAHNIISSGLWFLPDTVADMTGPSTQHVTIVSTLVLEMRENPDPKASEETSRGANQSAALSAGPAGSAVGDINVWFKLACDKSRSEISVDYFDEMLIIFLPDLWFISRGFIA